MEVGKLSISDLQRLVLEKIPRKDPNVLLWPGVGEDGAAVKLPEGNNIVVAVADPITGATKLAGWLAVHVNANDIAVHGALPKWFLTIILVPPGGKDFIGRLMDGVVEACNEIGCSIIGGHTEVTERVSEPVIAGFMLGVPIRPGMLVKSSGAKAGDAIIMTKYAGIEGTFILCSEFSDLILDRFGSNFLKRCLALRNKISVLRDMLALSELLDFVHAAHDVTEGGIIGGLYEMSLSSGVGFEVSAEHIAIMEETLKLSGLFEFDPLTLIGSGSVLLAVESEASDAIINALRRAGIPASLIGRFGGDERVIIREGKRISINASPVDALWQALKRGELLKARRAKDC